MAEFIPSILQSILGKVSGKFVTSLTQLWNMEDNRNQLEWLLYDVKSLMEGSGNVSWTRPSEKKLFKKIQVALDQADGVLEEFVYEAQYRDAQIGKSMAHKTLMAVNQGKPFVGSIILSRKLVSVLTQMKTLVEDMKASGLVHAAPSQVSFRQTTSLDIAMDIVGRDDDTASIVELLLAQKDQTRVQVLPIVGMGGLGKTTLAKIVYNDPRVDDHFPLKVWCCINGSFDVCHVLRYIIVTITNKEWRKGCDIQSLQNGLGEAISQRRLLLVLDDFAAGDILLEEHLKPPLCSSSGPGSCILLTSRSTPLASVVSTLQPYQLQCLTEHESWEVFSKRAFSHRIQDQEEFVLLGRKIVEMCNGLPLALRVMSGLMSTKERLADWEAIAKVDIRANAAFSDNVLSILRLSYNQLSSEEKQCFALASLFPKGSEIDTEMLIQLWAANSFIGEEPCTDVDEQGRVIISNFIAKGFLQDLKTREYNPAQHQLLGMYDYNFHMQTVRMHDFMHDLAKSMTDECATVEELLANKTKVENVRHLLIGDNTNTFEPERVDRLLKGMKSVRTSIITTEAPRNSVFLYDQRSKQLRLRSLRALQCDSAFLIHRHLISSVHLRYLDLSYLPIITLPDSLCRLYSLQTLRVVQCVDLICLPEELSNLRQLRHINNVNCYSLSWMPPNLGLLKLHTLPIFAVDDEHGRGIEELEHMNDLSNRLELNLLESIKCSSRAKRANLRQKSKVTELVLCWSRSRNLFDRPSDDEILKVRASVANNHKDVMIALEPHTQLHHFQIIGYKGCTMARWACDPRYFQCLKTLEIKNCPWLDEIPAVWFSGNLEYLTLFAMGFLSTLCLTNDSNATLLIFPGLKRLILRTLPRLENWAGNHAGRFNGLVIFPKLEELRVEFCRRVDNIPHCPVLKKIKLHNCDHIDLKELGRFSSLQEIAYRCPDRPLFFMPLNRWPSLHTLELSSLLHMKLLLPKEHIKSNPNHESDPGRPNYEEEIVPEQKLEWELDQGSVGRCFKNLEFLSLTGLSFTGSDILDEHDIRVLSCFNHVKTLVITTEIMCWPVELRFLTSLQTLKLRCCSKLVGPISDADVLPTKLLVLGIRSCDKLVKLPRLPNSLEELILKECKDVEHFSNDVCFPSLQYLEIHGCPKLQSACMPGGRYYQLISHVPRKDIEVGMRDKRSLLKNACPCIGM